MNTIHDTDVTFVLTSSPPQMRASGEKKLGTPGEKIKGTKSFPPQNMRFHYRIILVLWWVWLLRLIVQYYIVFDELVQLFLPGSPTFSLARLH